MKTNKEHEAAFEKVFMSGKEELTLYDRDARKKRIAFCEEKEGRLKSRLVALEKEYCDNFAELRRLRREEFLTSLDPQVYHEEVVEEE